MKVVHSVSLETFMYPTEDSEKVRKALDLILPEKAKLIKERLDSYYGSYIIKLSYEANKAPDIKKVLECLISKLSRGDKADVIKTIDERMDENGNFYLRFDKQKAYLGELALGYRGDTIKMRIKISSFPATLTNMKYNAKIIFE